MKPWEKIVRDLGLEPHPEGGWFRQTWMSSGNVEGKALPDHSGDRPYLTSILFLITAENFSAFHRLASDEIWYHHAGDPLEVVMIHPDGRLESPLAGSATDGYPPQLAVPAGTWFGSRVAAGGEWSLVGCAVAPGFEFDDFELAGRKSLVSEYPQHRKIIEQLTR